MTATEQWLQDAKARHTSGDLASAEPLYQRVLDELPDNGHVLYLLGTLLVQTRRFEEAAARLERALTAGVANVTGTRNNLGIALRELRRPEEAISQYDGVLALKPNDIEALNNRGVALYDLGRAEEAKTCYRRVLELQPDYVQALNNLGLILRDEKHLDEAAETLERAVALKPDYVEGLNNLGLIWQARKDFERALPWHQRAVELRPDDPEALNNLGANYMSLLRAEEAMACFTRALVLRPAYADAQNNISNVLLVQNRPTEAIPHAERALAMQEYYPSAHWNRGIALLMTGDLKRGWEGYEWRFDEDRAQKRMFATPIRTDVPIWQGEDLDGKTLWVRCEQGSGDMLQYARFLPALQARGARVIFECANALHRILDGGADVLIGEVAPDAPPPEGCDFQIYLMSLTHRLGITFENLPNTPYLQADPAHRDEWERHLAHIQREANLPPDNLKVGIVWAGSATHGNDANRSATLADFAALASVPGVTLFSLQKNKAAAQADDPPAGMLLVNLGPSLHDFADTAAVMANLDLIIAVDTSVVHLAGALGRTVWTVLPHHPDWRWMLNRADSPWYPTMRLFRQPAPKEWPTIFAEVRQALEQLASARTRDEAVVEAERLFASGERQEARQRLQALTRQSRPSVRALNDLGAICWQDGDRREALELFLRALQADPSDETTRLNCADALRAYGHEEDAEALLRAAEAPALARAA